MKKVFSIALSLFLLASHISLTIGTHFCGGEAVEKKVVWASSHLGCGMEDMDESNKDASNTTPTEKTFSELPCCENEFQALDVTDDFVKDASSFVINIDFVHIHVLTLLGLDITPVAAKNHYAENSPPPLERDIQILFQSFLI